MAAVDFNLHWESYLEGETIGQPGPEGGLIILDDWIEGKARITLESNTHPAPFVVTCGVSSLLVHSRYFKDYEEAIEQTAQMKEGIMNIVLLITDSDPLDGNDPMYLAVEQFVEQFPF